MKKYFVFFSNPEAFLRFQYICQKIRRSNRNPNIVIADFLGKELNIVYLKKEQSNLILKDLFSLSANCEEFLIINLKNKSTIDIAFLDFFESIQNKEYKYLENKIYSCNHDRLNIAMKSLLQDISSDVAKKDLTFEIKIARQKKDILSYFESVVSFVKMEINDKLIYDMLYIVYCINNIDSFKTKSIFYSKQSSLTLNSCLEYYKNVFVKINDLYKQGIITYPFEEECEIIKENQILQEEQKIIHLLKEESHGVTIHDKNSILLSDIAFVYHVEDEDATYPMFIEMIGFCIEKDIFYFFEGKLYMTKNGEKLYNSIINRDLEKYLLKGF